MSELNQDPNRKTPDLLIAQGINFKFEIPRNSYSISAWHSAAAQHFSSDTSALKLIPKGDEQLLIASELSEHFYEVIRRGIKQLQEPVDHYWKRFLAAGPDLQSPRGNKVDLLFANLLFCADCLESRESFSNSTEEYKRITEACSIMAAHMLEQSAGKNNPLDSYVTSAVTVRLNEYTAPRSASEIIAINAVINLLGPGLQLLQRYRKENGMLGDKILNFSAESIGIGSETTIKNYRLLESTKARLAESVAPNTWSGADKAARALKSEHGGHISCETSMIYKNTRLRKALLGLLHEASLTTDRILLMGNEWIDLIPCTSDSKEARMQLIQSVNLWIDDSGRTSLHSWLKLPTYPSELDILFSFLEVVKKLPRPAGYAPEIAADSAASIKDYPETNILIVGKSNWSGFFTDMRYRSLQLLPTQSGSHLNLSLPMGNHAGNLLLPVAAHELGDKYPLGLWNTGYVPRKAVWDFAVVLPEPLSQLSHFKRHSAGPLSSNEHEKFHNGYVFVHERTDDRIRKERKRKGGILAGT